MGVTHRSLLTANNVMLSTILLSMAPALAPASPTPSPVLIACIQDDVEKQIADAGDDIEKLMALAQSFKDAEDDASARTVYEKVITLDKDHEAAHKALRHHNYDGQWFKSYAALSKYRRAEKKRMKEKGLIRYNNDWVSEKEVPYLRMNWTKQDDGKFINPVALARETEATAAMNREAQFRTEDSSWVEKADFDRWSAGDFKIGEEWVSADEAQAHHGQIGQAWKQSGRHFVAHSTCDTSANRDIAMWADATYPNLVRLYGLEPTQKPSVAVFNSLVQFNQFAAGDQALQVQPGETGGYSSAHFAFYADVWFDMSAVPEGGAPEYLGGGAAYYDVSGGSKIWGEYSVRHAAGLSYGESIDHAWGTISEVLSGDGGGGGGLDGVWEEKSVPRWMLYGGATYVERWAPNANNPDNPWGIRDFAMGELSKTGGLDEMETFLDFALDINDLDSCVRMIMGAGGVVSFILEGECEPVMEAHEAFKEALKSGSDTAKAVEDLEKALTKNEKKLRKYLNL
jgi:tetratricopeptide (TPR) repeat protein